MNEESSQLIDFLLISEQTHKKLDRQLNLSTSGALRKLNSELYEQIITTTSQFRFIMQHLKQTQLYKDWILQKEPKNYTIEDCWILGLLSTRTYNNLMRLGYYSYYIKDGIVTKKTVLFERKFFIYKCPSSIRKANKKCTKYW